MSNKGSTPSLGQDPTQPLQGRSGRPSFGVDGRSIWEWQTAPGIFSREITDEQLRALQAPQLQLAEPSDAVTIRRPRPALTPAALAAAAEARRQAARDGKISGKLRRLLRRMVGLSS